jgi:hypothetical protein
MTEYFFDEFDDSGRTILGDAWKIIGGGFKISNGMAISTGTYSTAGRAIPLPSPVRRMHGIIGVPGSLYLFPFVSATGILSIGLRVTTNQIALVGPTRSVIAGTANTRAIAPGDVVEIIHDAETKSVRIKYNGTQMAGYAYTSPDVSSYPYAAMGTGTLGAGWAAVSADDGQPNIPPAPVPVPIPQKKGRPSPIPSYGPNGTHWPEKTPWVNDDVPTVIEVESSWSEVKKAIQGLTDDQVNHDVKILVPPGPLVGQGGAESSFPVLDTVGRTTWDRNVLVMPRDGFGSVQITGLAARFRKVHGVTFAMFDGMGITRSGCTNNTLAWCRLNSHRTTGLNGQVTKHSDLYEVVIPGARVADIDPAGFASGYPGATGSANENAWLRDCEMVGSYCAPNWVPVGGIGHNDSLQFYGAGVYGGFELRDTALFGSNNCALQIGGWSAGFDALWPDMDYFLKLNHCLLVGPQSNNALRYNYPDGIKLPTLNQAINGAGRPGYLMSEGGTVIVGSIYPTEWARVTDTRVHTPSPRVKVREGGFTVDTSLQLLTREQMDQLSPIPTQEYLTQIWDVL